MKDEVLRFAVNIIVLIGLMIYGMFMIDEFETPKWYIVSFFTTLTLIPITGLFSIYSEKRHL